MTDVKVIYDRELTAEETEKFLAAKADGEAVAVQTEEEVGSDEACPGPTNPIVD